MSIKPSTKSSGLYGLVSWDWAVGCGAPVCLPSILILHEDDYFWRDRWLTGRPRYNLKLNPKSWTQLVLAVCDQTERPPSRSLLFNQSVTSLCRCAHETFPKIPTTCTFSICLLNSTYCSLSLCYHLVRHLSLHWPLIHNSSAWFAIGAPILERTEHLNFSNPLIPTLPL